MFQSLIFRLLSLGFLFALVLVGIAPALLDDKLFYSSDGVSLFLTLLALTLILLPFLFLPLLVVCLAVPRWRDPVLRGLTLAPLVLLLSGFLVLVLDRAFAEIESNLAFAALCLVTPILVAWGLAKLPGREGIAERMNRLAAASLVVGLLAFAGLWTLQRVGSSAVAEGPGRHLVFLLLDGLPASHLRAYNPKAPERPFDAVVEQSLLLENMHTAAVFTNAYFSTFYNGSTHRALERSITQVRSRELPLSGVIGRAIERVGRAFGSASPNLLSELQAAGVATRWITMHRNGIPEGTAGRIGGYAGLRSELLNQYYSWLPRGLGLDYHLVAYSSPLVRRNSWLSERKRATQLFINGEYVIDNMLTEIVLPEIRQIQARNARSFVVVHGTMSLSDNIDAPWLNDEADAAMTPDLVDEGYYGPEFEEWAARKRRALDYYVGMGTDRVLQFLEALKAAGLAEQTSVIVTSDHGTAFQGGRVGYIVHPLETVMRVPLIAINAGQQGRRAASYSTIDLSRTVLDFFGVHSRLAPRATSFLADEAPAFTASITYPSPARSEWFLAIYRGDRKYQFNLHREGDGRAEEFMAGDFHDEVIREGPEVVAEVAAAIRSALDEYSIEDGVLHPSYRRAALPQ